MDRWVDEISWLRWIDEGLSDRRDFMDRWIDEVPWIDEISWIDGTARFHGSVDR
jgi:hypothetical protein